MTKKILIDVPPIHDDGLKAFDGVPGIEIVRYDRATESLEDAIKDVDAVMVGLAIFDEKTINMAPNLKILAKHGVGYDNVDITAASERNIWVTNVPDVFIEEVADHTMTLLLGAWRGCCFRINWSGKVVGTRPGPC